MALQSVAFFNKIDEGFEMVRSQLVVPFAEGIALTMRAKVAWWARASHQSIDFSPDRRVPRDLLFRIKLGSAIG